MGMRGGVFEYMENCGCLGCHEHRAREEGRREGYAAAALLCERMAEEMGALGLTGSLGLRREQSTWHEAAWAIRRKLGEHVGAGKVKL